MLSLVDENLILEPGVLGAQGLLGSLALGDLGAWNHRAPRAERQKGEDREPASSALKGTNHSFRLLSGTIVRGRALQKARPRPRAGRDARPTISPRHPFKWGGRLCPPTRSRGGQRRPPHYLAPPSFQRGWPLCLSQAGLCASKGRASVPHWGGPVCLTGAGLCARLPPRPAPPAAGCTLDPVSLRRTGPRSLSPIPSRRSPLRGTRKDSAPGRERRTARIPGRR